MKKDIRYIIIIACLLLFLLMLILVVNHKSLWLENKIYLGLIKFKSYDLTAVMKTITFLASTKFIISLSLVSLAFLYYKNISSIFLITNVIITILINNIFKLLVHRPRPIFINMINESGYSFPSGHAMGAVAFYGFLIFLIIRSKIPKLLKWIIGSLSTIIIILIGMSRIYLGVHYPTDVISGYLLATVILLIFTIMYDRYKGVFHA